MKIQNDPGTIAAAIVGYETKIEEMQQTVRELRNQLRGEAKTPTPIKAKRHWSAEAKQRIAEAQRKRWRKYHREKKAAAA